MEGRTYTPYFIVAFVVSSFENKFDILSSWMQSNENENILYFGEKRMTQFEKTVFTEMVSLKRLLKRDIKQLAFTYTVFSKPTPSLKVLF